METLARYTDWVDRFEQAIERHRSKSFSWGSEDCCCVTFDIVFAMTGRDLYPYKGKYDTIKGMRTLGETIHDGPNTPEGFATYILGPPQPAINAKVGDVMCFEKGQWNCIGILTSMGAMFRCIDNFIFVPIDRCKCSWKIA